ncbi:MAG TPA: STAS domain-containing protein [Candidatus Limnocylindrales bacterium]|nr:STAS domain-containing protein [Candidatus Limnocylindrales bacterium]
MDATPLTADVAPVGATSVIMLRGRIDREGEAALSGAYSEAARLAAPVIELDFGAVDYINSTGIALIVSLLADARRDRREVRARGLSEHYREIFRITRLSDYITLLDEPAVATAGEGGRR